MGNVMNNPFKNSVQNKCRSLEIVVLGICLNWLRKSKILTKYEKTALVSGAFHIKLLSINIFIIMCLIFLSGTSNVFAFKEAGIIPHNTGKTEISESIMECRRQIDSITNQISLLKENRAWLNSKIDDIKDFNRQVPESMEKSIVFKTWKINALEKIKKRLTANLKDLVKKSENTDRAFLSSPAGNRKKTSVQDKKYRDEKAYVSIQRTGESAKKNNFTKELQRRIKKLGLENWVEIVSNGKCCRLVTTLPILFASGSSKIAGTYKKFFKKLADLIRGYDVRVGVDGYADIDSIHNKRYPSNFELGAARASNVVHELVKYGIKPSVFKISTTGRYRFNARGISKKKVVERRADLTIIFTV